MLPCAGMQLVGEVSTPHNRQHVGGDALRLRADTVQQVDRITGREGMPGMKRDELRQRSCAQGDEATAAKRLPARPGTRSTQRTKIEPRQHAQSVARRPNLTVDAFSALTRTETRAKKNALRTARRALR